MILNSERSMECISFIMVYNFFLCREHYVKFLVSVLEIPFYYFPYINDWEK